MLVELSIGSASFSSAVNGAAHRINSSTNGGSMADFFQRSVLTCGRKCAQSHHHSQRSANPSRTYFHRSKLKACVGSPLSRLSSGDTFKAREISHSIKRCK